MREVRGPSQKSRDKMPNCTKCGTAVADNAAFFPNCGVTLLAAGSPKLRRCYTHGHATNWDG
jgi:hypothetical protein